MGKWTRRAFITTGIITGGALVIGVAIRPGNRSDKVKHLIAKSDETVFNIWLKISPDNTITLYVPHSEMGQGIHTTLGMMVAEELDANWDQVKILEAPANKEYANYVLAKGFVVGDKNIPAFLNGTVDGVFLTAVKSMNLQITGGSGSVRFTGRSGISIAGATMKELLKQAAATDWEVDIKELKTENSMIVHEASKRSATYASLAKSAVELSVSGDIKLKSFDQYKIVGTDIPRRDIPSKVNGTVKFSLDVKLEGLKYATLQAAPVFGNVVKTYDKEAILQMPGVQKIINLKSALAVVADGYWQAKMALNRANIEWSVSENNQVNQQSIFDQYTVDLENAIKKNDLEDDIKIGNVEKNEEDMQQFDAKYQIPYLAHATMEPMNCTAVVKKEQCEIWCGSQNPLGYKAAVAEALDFDMDQVLVNNHFMGGGFGRRAESDIVVQAAKIAKEVTYPVKLIWSREEDIRQDFYREANVSWFNATLDHAGKPKKWTNRFLFKHHPPEASHIPYAIDHQLIQYTESPTHIPWGNWRSVDHSMHGFFTESFIDELANEANKDPYEYRRDLLAQKPRFLKVLNKAAELANWRQSSKKNFGQGIAIHKSFGTIVAQVADVEIVAGKPRIVRVVCVADPGYAIHPDGFKAQMESGIIYGLTAALYGEISIEEGAIKQGNFHDYKMLRMDECPIINTYIINGGDPIGGAGEPSTPVIGPAVTNAIFHATGIRIRELPINKYDLSSLLT